MPKTNALKKTLQEDSLFEEESESTKLAKVKKDVLNGLSKTQKSLPSYLFYDYKGSQVFEQITRLEEYYVPACEVEIFERFASEIAEACGKDVTLVEFGSGSSKKTGTILEALGRPHAYVPIDISGDFLQESAKTLQRRFPGLAVYPVQADFNMLEALPDHIDLSDNLLGFFPGSTIGNLEPDTTALDFLKNTRKLLGGGARFLIGADLIKDRSVLHRAYNDSEGVTARFNLNMLRHINALLDANFNVADFEHNAVFNVQKSRMEMHLVSLKDQAIKLCGRTFTLKKGETIHTENCYKYTPERFQSLAQKAGWKPLRFWLDQKKYYSVHLLSSS